VRRLRDQPLLLAGLLLVALLVLVAAGGPWLAPHDPLAMDLRARLSGATADYPLGTDHLGRCLLSRLLHGARLSLGASLVVSLLVLLPGLAVGLAAGLGGRRLDSLLMRVVDIFLAFPSLVLALAVIGVLGPSLPSAATGIVLGWWPLYARMVRGTVLAAREREFVLAARAAGTGGGALVWRCILPQVAPPLLVMLSLEVGAILLVFSGLSFLGLGAQPPTPEWGAMLNEARTYLRTAPHLMAWTGGAITVAVLAFNLVGEGLRDLFQVREMTTW
jgi:peptide/nickel transport system permease protein